MRLSCLVVFACMLVGCDTQAFVARTVPEVIRDGARTVAEVPVRADIEEFATSDEMRRIVTDLTHAVMAAAEGEVDEAAIERALRSLIGAAIEALRNDLGFVTPDLERGYERVMHDVDAMLAHLVSRTMSQVRGMVDGGDISSWVRDLLSGVLSDVMRIAGAELDDEAATHLGRFVRVAFREVLADVDVAAETRGVAQAAALGAGDGFGESLDGRLGKAIDHQSARLARTFGEALTSAAEPWREAAYLFGGVAAVFLIVMLVMGGLWLTTHRDHERTIMEVQYAAREGKNAQSTLDAIRKRGIKLQSDKDPPKS